MTTLDSVVAEIPLVDLKAQYVTIAAEIGRAVAAVIDQSAFIGGAHVRDFEAAFAASCGVEHCIGVANGTDALFVALRTLGVGPGDEVITAANTFIATAEAVAMAGARVVFADVDPVTLTIDPEEIRRRITPRTRAIIPVHLYGHPADMDPIVALARQHGLWVVGDAAQAHGARYRGAPVAPLADITCYSFYPGKNLGAYGDAGAIVTNHETWARRARMLANHGRTQKYDHEFVGVNSRLDGLQAAVLGVKLPHLERWTESRRRAAATYGSALQGLPLVLPREIGDVRAVYHLYVVRVPGGGRERDALRDFLKTGGIEAGVHYPTALPYLSAYRYLNHAPEDFPESRRASGEILSLPLYAELTDRQVHAVAGRVRQFFDDHAQVRR